MRSPARLSGLLAAAVVSTIAGCAAGEPRIDASSLSALDSSSREVRAHLRESDRELYDAALAIILWDRATTRMTMDAPIDSLAPDATFQAIGRDVDGLTGRQIIAKADSITARRPLPGRE